MKKVIFVIALLMTTYLNARSPVFSKEFIDKAMYVCESHRGLQYIKWVDVVFTGKFIIKCNDGTEITRL